ncbi:MAG: riboflavin synthase [bacterium]
MFTGLVEELGTIRIIEKRGKSLIFTVHGPQTSRGIRIDESVAINGVCLTVIKTGKGTFNVQAVEETLRKTNLGKLQEGGRVNLERALLLNERLGGHFVLGHVDCVAKVHSVIAKKSSWIFWFKLSRKYSRYLIPVGSIAIDGVSLTVARLKELEFAVSIIPHTWEVTTFKFLKPGDPVNIEFDMLGKYVDRILKRRFK